MVLSNEELNHIIAGGAKKYAVGFIVSSLAVLIAGFIDGFLRPLTCHK